MRAFPADIAMGVGEGEGCNLDVPLVPQATTLITAKTAMRLYGSRCQLRWFFKPTLRSVIQRLLPINRRGAAGSCPDEWDFEYTIRS